MAPGEDNSVTMQTGQWQYQLRLELNDSVIEAVRTGCDIPVLGPLYRILARHDATLICQYDAFAGYCEEAERNGISGYPLYAWTRATIRDPVKKARYVKIFSICVEDKETYPGDKADALENDLHPLVDGPVVKRLARYDTNPANNPQVPERYRS